jgi:hypothetical protein
MSTFLRSAVIAFLLLAAGRAAQADPDAQSILANARMAQAGQQRTLTGHLRVQATGQIIPFTLVLDGGTIRYEFADDAIILRMGNTGAQLLESAHGDLHNVSPARYDKPVEGTDITYEDISLRFLYWPQAKIDGSELVGELNCWKLSLLPGGEKSAYGAVQLWVRKQDGTLLKVEGYDTAGKLVKRFEVAAVQQDPNGGWMLKKLKIVTLGQGDAETITYLEIDK